MNTEERVQEKSIILDGCVFHVTPKGRCEDAHIAWEKTHPLKPDEYFTLETAPKVDNFRAFFSYKFHWWWRSNPDIVCQTYRTVRPLRLYLMPLDRSKNFDFSFPELFDAEKKYHERYDGFIFGGDALEIFIFNERDQAKHLFRLVKTEECDTIPSDILTELNRSFMKIYTRMLENAETASNVYSLFPCFQ